METHVTRNGFSYRSSIIGNRIICHWLKISGQKVKCRLAGVPKSKMWGCYVGY